MQQAGYFELLRTNRAFRNLWFGEIASHLGDWFNTVAIYTLVERLTGSPLALGLVFITKLLPFALAAPFAGLMNDRLNRRRLMIFADLARALLVLGLLTIDRPEEMPLLYLLIGSQVLLSAVFIPAKNASIPNITNDRELLTANSLSAATWSVLLAVGAALGGFATDWLGEQTVFVVDSLSYLISACMIFGIKIPQQTDSGKLTVTAAVAEITDGWRTLFRRPEIGRIALAKAAWSLGGGALVYTLLLLGQQNWPASPAIGIGILYSARGLGTAAGPLLARKLFPREHLWPRLCGLFIIGTGSIYAIATQLPWSVLSVALIFLAHIPSGANWVLSSVLLQKRTEDRYRGRVFATEFLLLTLADTAAVLTASVLLDRGHLELTQVMLVFALLQVAAGLVWLWIVVPKEERFLSEQP